MAPVKQTTGPKQSLKGHGSIGLATVCLVAAFLAIGGGFVLREPRAQAWLKGHELSGWVQDTFREYLTPYLSRQQQAAAHLDAVPVQAAAHHAAHLRSTLAEPASSVQEQAAAACRLSGNVADCECDYASVEHLNQRYVHPLMAELTTHPFFKFFKVNLYCDCQFWPDSSMCFQRDCCVSECDEDDIPHAWRRHDEALAALRKHQASCDGAAGVDRSVEPEVEDALSSVPNWHLLNNPWVPEDDQGVDYIYVDLSRNIEKYTGYKGEDARRIWAAIYEQKAIKQAAQAGMAAGSEGEAGSASPAAAAVSREQRVLYRLISGMHASITMSIIQNFYNEQTGQWGPNLGFFKARFASPASQPYVENMYFTYLFVLRAIAKAKDALMQLDYHSGWSLPDGMDTKALVSMLVSSRELQGACPTPFDEGLLWRHDTQRSEELRRQLQVTFHNITHLMDCVGCEKCKMHGKLNMLGIATALKVLFSQQHAPASLHSGGHDMVHLADGAQHPLHLDRNEAIALINFFAKLSDSVEGVRQLSTLLQQQEEQQQQAGCTPTHA